MIGILQNLVVALSANADIKVVLIALLFGLMVVGLVLGQELAFVLGGAGVLIGAIAMGDSGVTIAMTKIYDQMQSYSMVAIPMFVLMANFLTHSKVADGLFESVRYLFGPVKGGLAWRLSWSPPCSPLPQVSSALPWSPWACCPCPSCCAAAISPLWPAAWCVPAVLWVS